MAAGKLELGPIITHRLPLPELPKALELMKKQLCLKVLMLPGTAS